MVKWIAVGAMVALGIVQAHAADYLLVCAPTSCTASDGTLQAPGTALNRVVWDGRSPFSLSVGQQLVPDDGRAIYQPPTPKPTTIPSMAFLDRFTAAEQGAVQQAAAAAPATLGVGLTTGLAAGQINLAGCPAACTDTTLKAWMDGLVAAGAITAARETAILTP